MQTQHTAASAASHDLADYFQNVTNSHADRVAGGLVLDRLPFRELTWLKPYVQLEPDDALHTITAHGRDLTARWRAAIALFGREVS